MLWEMSDWSVRTDDADMPPLYELQGAQVLFNVPACCVQQGRKTALLRSRHVLLQIIEEKTGFCIQLRVVQHVLIHFGFGFAQTDEMRIVNTVEKTLFKVIDTIPL